MKAIIFTTTVTINSIYEHNTYTSAIGITYQLNHMGPLRTDSLGKKALGNNLKDRSAGLVVRYNWIENGNRQLDLVDGEDSDNVVNHPAYRTTHVYGNILKEADGEGNRKMVHYGGDSGILDDYRKGTLYLYNNTLISTRSDRNTILSLSSPGESAEVFNNIIYTTAPGSTLALLGTYGTLTFRNNWLKSGWRDSFDGTFLGTVIDDGSNIKGDDPGVIDLLAHNYHLSDSSEALNQGLPLLQELETSYPLLSQYVTHMLSEPRPTSASLDIGAFEKAGGVIGDLNENGAIDLGDVIVTLKLLAGYQETFKLKAGTDVDGDNKVTLVEAIYGLSYLVEKSSATSTTVVQ
ncbi:MAG: hypothetical protein ACI8PB_005352 [Desulforhopalus sp.]